MEGNLISIDEFCASTCGWRKYSSAEMITGADKLLKLRVDVGEFGEREIFAGIRAAYDPVAGRPTDRRGRQSGAAQNALRRSRRA